jgi:hypothetical protein
MNERIFELAKQADLIHWDTLPSGARTPDHESVVKAKKFAELIVGECMFAVENHGGMCGAASSKKIREHFGVEE